MADFKKLDCRNKVLIDRVDKCCYLGRNTLNTYWYGCDAAVMARVRRAWKRFQENFNLF